MKKFYGILCLLVFSVVSCSKYDDSEIWDYVRNMNNRLTALEEKCREMNTNISSLQTIIGAAENGDYITNVAPVTKDGKIIGYTISFKKAEPITIYNGKDGENGINGTNGTNGIDGTNGINGTNGTDGHTPNISVKKDTDGLYYWTIDGEWLLDDEGNKVRASGIDGKDGTNGTNGEDGITPQLKIEDGFWYVSYDSGVTWQVFGKATGPKGNDGNSLFSSVEIGENEVTFVLFDGTTFTIPLQSSGIGDDDTPDSHEWVDLDLPSGTLWATCNIGANTPEEFGDYFAWGETEPKDNYSWSTYRYCNGSTQNTLTKYCNDRRYGYNEYVDFYTEILPEDDAATVNWGKNWQMPSREQFDELLANTTTIWTKQNGVYGRKITSNSSENSIFLPAAGEYYEENISMENQQGRYYSRTIYNKNPAGVCCLLFGNNAIIWNYYDREVGSSVRPVQKQ